ncbi:Ti-type conjugative transfer relaxase TraA [Asticcacaulis sp. ZE23SCel15]|uniref:Ti-type conjugative transfer relaxase TraA n=1 Tax=Asticcacaulis sp. ZE23SCel15 TaxID=3059027 RepID=UPI00265E97D3|nr:Ti-type conjugative transfer relaxase TraA [Asticcacaulis sp. ZE23SCel15]WKL57388.1 Ti-type conjugative transfer relaxase TraA [Asticcacaulis sp. ZE23SCel15]
MAIYHLSVKVISRAAGSSAVAAAAYRSAGRLFDERLDRAQDFTNKSGVVHSEVMLPDNAPPEWSDRERLWNDVEAFEKRKDAQLSREVEFAIPREMTQSQGIDLARDFVQREFVDQGMVADLNVHWDIGSDGRPKPHAHVMLTMREVSEDGFGPKVRDWNRVELVEHWREAWAEHVNARLVELDIDARIDHRTLEEQGIDLEPQGKIGAAARRMEAQGLEAERIEDHTDIAYRNGERILANPKIALDAIIHTQATFTKRDLAMFVHRHSDGADQFNAVMTAVRQSPDLVELGKDGRGDERFTSRDMIETEQRLQRAADLMKAREHHRVSTASREMVLGRAEVRGFTMSGEQNAALAHVTKADGLSIVVGYAGTGKSAMLGIAKEAWEDAGYTVRGAALSGIAAENLETGSGIASRTIASLEHQWGKGRELLSARDVLVVDEAGMVGSRQMERVLSAAAEAGAKVVLVGDPEQLQAIEAGAAFRSIHERHGGVEITQVRRQQEGWQRDATRHLATGRTAQALHAYYDHGHVHEAESREDARQDLVERWDKDRIENPEASRLILTHTNDEVQALNALARDRLKARGELGDYVDIKVERGDRTFASGDRVLFLKNERGLDENGGVKNGTLGTAEVVDVNRMSVRLDDGRSVAFDLKDYNAIDHGYAVTIHKSQGVTIDRVHVLATPGLDSHSNYVALSRHRDRVDLHYGKDDFDDLNRLGRTLLRERSKDMALDHDGAKDFAERRGLSFRERVVEIIRKVPEKVRSMFDGLDLGQRSPTPQPTDYREDREALRRSAIQRHAGAVKDIFHMHDKDLPVLPHQTTALKKAREELTTFDKHAVHDLERAYSADPAMASEAAGGRTQRSIRVLQMEAEMRADPVKRADRFVDDWTRMDARRVGAERSGDTASANRLRDQMGAMAKIIERDPQMELLLRNRRLALGLSGGPGWDMERKLSQELGASIGLERSRGISIGM